VSSEGWIEAGEKAFIRGRKYQSSGMQKRNLGFWPELSKDDWTRSANTDEENILKARE